MWASNPICWFEVEDFLVWLLNQPNPTGIQRVEREILTEIEQRYVPLGRANFCRLNRVTHEFEPVDLSFLAETTRDWRQIATPIGRPVPLRMAGLGHRLLSALGVVERGPAEAASGPQGETSPWRKVPFAPGDVLVSLGAAWHDKRYAEIVGCLRRERRVRCALLLHDLIPVTHPEWVPPSLSESVRRWVPEMFANADLLLTSSDYARREMIAYAAAEDVRLPPVEVLRLGTGFQRWNPAASVDRKSAVRLPEPFVLCVSTIEFRKNHQLLIRIWQRLIERHGAAAVPHLVFLGRVGWGVDDLMRRLEESRHLDGKVVIASDLTDAELEDAYRSCRIIVLPSLSEGWGLPVAESLERGKLCVASDRASIPEVGGDLVDYFDPDDIEDAQQKIERALFDAAYLAQREQRIRSDFQRASWAACTDTLMEKLEGLPELPVAVSTAPDSPPKLRIQIAPPRNPARRRILVLKLDHLGDLLIAVPALTKLRDAFRDDEITLVCGSWNRTLAESLEIFDRVLTHDYLARNASAGDSRPAESMQHFESLLSGSYDIAIDLRVEPDTRILLAHVNADMKCGLAADGTFPYLDVALPLAAGRIAIAESGPSQHVFGPGDFLSRVPGNALFIETDFSFTNSFAVYGPYVRLPRGEHVARFYFTAIGHGSETPASEITFDVAQSGTRLASMRLDRRGGRARLAAGSVGLSFSNHAPDAPFEFRLFTRGRPYAGSLRFFGVTVESASAAGWESPRHSRQLHMGELLSLLVQLVADRSRPAHSLPSPARKAPANSKLDARLSGFLALEDTILVAPFSNKPTRDWPLSYYGQLVSKILGNLGNPVALLGAPEHHDALDRIARENEVDGRLYNLSGKTEWTDLPRLFEQARLVISNNSGIAHYAAACGAPLVAIYSGAVLPDEWRPRGENTIVTISADVPCSPCGFNRLEECDHEHRCMRSIAPDSVYAEISRMLETSPGA